MGTKWGQVQRDLPGDSGAFEDLEAQAGLIAFLFPFQGLAIAAA